jgi:hypothetical protein
LRPKLDQRRPCCYRGASLRERTTIARHPVYEYNDTLMLYGR